MASIDATTTRADERFMIKALSRLVKRKPLFLSEQSDEEAYGDPDMQDQDDE